MAFVDLAGVAQTTLQVADGQLGGTTLTSATGGFNTLAAGAVVVLRSGVTDAVVAVASVPDDHTLELADVPTALPSATDLTVIARTFAAQAQQVHEQLLRAIGIDDANTIVSTGLMQRLEVLGTLAMACRAAAGPFDAGDALAAKAAEYDSRFARALESARILIDTDGDGLADVWRLPAAARLVRL